MKLRVFLVLPILSLGLPRVLAQTATQADDRPEAAHSSAAQLYGKLDGDTYISGTALFKIKIPVLPQLGGAISDTPNIVTFDDDFSIHTSVGAFALSREVRWEYDARGAKDFLVYFFTSFVMPDFVTRFPGARAEDNAIFLPKCQDGALLIFALLPGGSFFEQRAKLSASMPPVVAKRGNLCFVKNCCFFVISTELAERAIERSTYKKTPEEEDAILRERLLNLLGRMQLIPPPPEGKS
jgi:hypothetical protein